MKIKPTIYAEALIESATGGNLKEIAARFWNLLQKNKQYKDMPKILELIEEESAKKNGQVLAKVYSEKELTDAEKKEICEKLNCHYSSSPAVGRVEKSNVSSRPRSNNSIVIKNIIKPNNGGITVKIDDKLIDLSTDGKIEGLKRKLSS